MITENVDVTKHKWVAKDGSIFTEQKFEFKPPIGRKKQVPVSVAFNVGRVAEHIVNLHNQSLK